jgi:hypothetical protein
MMTSSGDSNCFFEQLPFKAQGWTQESSIFQWCSIDVVEHVPE